MGQKIVVEEVSVKFFSIKDSKTIVADVHYSLDNTHDVKTT